MIGLKTSLAGAPAALFAFTSLAQAQANRPEDWYHGPGMMYGGGGMFFGFFFMVILLAAVAIGLLLLLRALGFIDSPGRTAASNNRALDILKERFAKGEIDAKEFDERKRHLAD